MTSTLARLRLQFFLAVVAVVGATLAYAGASMTSGTAPLVSAAGPSACTSVSLKAAAAGGSHPSVALTAAASCAGSPSYAFFVRAASSSPWTLIRGWGGPTFTASGSAGGLTQFLAWATDGALTVPQVQSEQTATLAASQQAPCTAVGVSPSPTATEPGRKTTFTATASCPASSQVEYSYFERSVGAPAWTLMAAWIGPSWTWSAPTAAGTYQVLAWASDGPYTVPQVQSSTYVYDGVAATCTAVSAEAQPSSGSALTITASSTCPIGTTPEYSYFVGPGAAGPWTLVAAWIGPSFSWNPTPSQASSNHAIVWVSAGPYTVPQAQTTIAFTPPPTAGCSAVTPATSPAGSAPAGSAVSVEASSTCTSGSAAEYSYFTGPSAAGPWTLGAAWIGASWTWNTAGLAPGTYYALVWASDGPYTVPQVQASVPITLTGAAPGPVSGSPLSNPASNLTSNFGASCWPGGYLTSGCEQAEVADIDSALATEGLQPLSWSAALYALPASQQEFVVTNEERVLRGLAPIPGMDTAADQNALVGAQAEEDPPTQLVSGEIVAEGNWAEDFGPLASDFDWMYNDGPGSFNIDCPTGSTSSLCWVHRDTILTNTVSGPLGAPAGYTWVAGDACVPDAALSYDTICDLEYVLLPTSSVSYDFTWAQALALGA